MAILRGIFGSIKWDPAGAPGTAAVVIASLNAWTLEATTEKEDVTCYGDTNRVYLPGMPDCQGTVAGFHNAAETTLWEAARATTPGWLELLPNNTEATTKFAGLAWMDASIDCTLAAPKISGTWMAAGPWTLPSTP